MKIIRFCFENIKHIKYSNQKYTEIEEKILNVFKEENLIIEDNFLIIKIKFRQYLMVF